MKRCSKCDKMKERGEFSKHKGRKDGLASRCKACMLEQYIRHRVARDPSYKHNPKIKEDLPVGLKRCTQCKKVKEKGEFSKQKLGKDGLQAGCKTCAVVATQARRDAVTRICVYEGCDIKQLAKDHCGMHYERIRRHGNPGPVGRLVAPKGSGWVNRAGYRVLYKPDHPNRTKIDTVMEHVLVMSEFLGHPVKKGDTIHHRNGIRDDNRTENLELWTGNHPSGVRKSDLDEWVIEYMKENKPEMLI